MGPFDKNPRDQSTDDGPYFLTDLLAELNHLQDKQEGIESKLSQLNKDHRTSQLRLEAIEKTLKAIGVRESDLVISAAKTEALRLGQRNTATAFLAVAVPIVVVFLAWFIPAAMVAIRHAQIEEERIDHPNGQYGPPVPQRLLREGNKKFTPWYN